MSAPGIEVRHGRGCPVETDAAGRCRCKPGPSYRASVWSRRDGKRIRRTFPTLAAAKAWRADAMGAVGKGMMQAPSRVTFREAADEWMEGARAGTIRTRQGKAFKPSTLRGYEQGLRDHVLPEFGAYRLHDLRRVELQDFADRLAARGKDASTVRNAIAPVRAVYRRALARGEVGVNPTTGLELPAPTRTRERIAAPEEAAPLLAVLPQSDRALWATALYAGLRRGELMALDWANIDMEAGVIRVVRAWDPKDHVYVEPKSKAGKRTVPIPRALRAHLAAHRLRTPWAEGLAFGRSAVLQFEPTGVTRRAATAWKNAKLEGIGLHECRHTFASLMIHAGVNAKALSTYMGHSSIVITLDRYGHMFPGNEAEAAGLLDAFLERADTGARLAQLSEA